MICPNCGNTIEDTDDYCAYCGTSVRSHTGSAIGSVTEQSSRRVAVAAAILVMSSVTLLAVLFYPTVVPWRNEDAGTPIASPTGTVVRPTAKPTDIRLDEKQQTGAKTGQPESTSMLPSPTWTPTFEPTRTRTPTHPPPMRTPTPESKALVTADTLNVRSGPGTEYDKIDQVHEGDHLAVLGREPECKWWWVVTPGGIRGWVSVQYVTTPIPPCYPRLTKVPPTPTPRPTSPPEPWRLIASSKDDFSDSQGAKGWAYMWEEEGKRGSFHWHPLPRYGYYRKTKSWCWLTDSKEPDIRICEGGEVHPGWGSNIAYQWRSSIDGKIRVRTHFHKIDTRCGDGVELAVFRGTTAVLPYRRIRAGDNQGRTDVLDVHVSQGDLLYFVITTYRESSCDMTRVDLKIYTRNP